MGPEEEEEEEEEEEAPCAMQLGGCEDLNSAAQVLHRVPVLALRGQVMFPGIRATVELPRRAALLAQRLIRGGRAGGLGVLAMRPGGHETYGVGTLCDVVSWHAVGAREAAALGADGAGALAAQSAAPREGRV